MTNLRVFTSNHFFQPSDGEPIRSVVTETKEAVVVAWHLKPGQKLLPHIHPHGQDSWTILAGRGEYTLDTEGTTQAITVGDIVVAPLGQVHGVLNNGDEALLIISVVSPAGAGYELV